MSGYLSFTAAVDLESGLLLLHGPDSGQPAAVRKGNRFLLYSPVHTKKRRPVRQESEKDSLALTAGRFLVSGS